MSGSISLRSIEVQNVGGVLKSKTDHKRQFGSIPPHELAGLEEIKFDAKDGDENSIGMLTNNMRSIIYDLEPTGKQGNQPVRLGSNDLRSSTTNKPAAHNREDIEGGGAEDSDDLGPVDEVEEE